MVALVLCIRTATSLARRGSSAQAKGQWKTLCCECTPHQFFLVLRQLWNGGDLPAVLSTPQHISVCHSPTRLPNPGRAPSPLLAAGAHEAPTSLPAGYSATNSSFG